MIIIILMIILNILLNKNILINSIIDSLNLWVYKIYPSFFIFYIISYFLLKKGILSKVAIILYPFFSFESKKAYELLFLSILISNPSTLKFSKMSYENNEISYNDLKKITYLSIFTNPLFILIFLDISFLIILLLIQLLIIYINDKLLPLNKNTFIYNDNHKESSLIILSNSLNQVINILLMILSSICFINIIKDSFVYLFNINNLYLFFFEISSGTNSILLLNENIILRDCLLTFLFTFQGIAINLQNYLVLKDTLKYKKVIILRITQALITSIIYFIFSYIVNS